MRTLGIAFASAVLAGCLSDSNGGTPSAPSSPSTPNTSEWKGAQLDQGLSEADVVAKIGKPDSISMRTCGENGAQWTCKQYSYNTAGGHRLKVFFSADGNYWTVNEWSAF
ncbi:MAG TPA: hypothetical protein VGI65_10245 [Steroidobacteraceae bacterium]